MRYFKQVCNWKKTYKEEKDLNESSDEDKDTSVDLLKRNKVTEDSLVEKEISISSTSEDE
jgi:hypothetical protein